MERLVRVGCFGASIHSRSFDLKVMRLVLGCWIYDNLVFEIRGLSLHPTIWFFIFEELWIHELVIARICSGRH